jgi:hypothetical protein
MRTSGWRCHIGRLTVPQLAAVLLLSGLTVLLIGLTVVPNVADAERRERQNCEARLANNTYSCNFRFQSGSVQAASLRFAVADGVLNVSADALGFRGLCQCGAAGTFRRPLFGESREFFCLIFDVGLMTGRAGSEGIRRGQILAAVENATAVFRCEQDGDDD